MNTYERFLVVGALIGGLVLPTSSSATPALYSPTQLQHQLDQARKSTEWQALEAWLLQNGYVKDTGTAVGGDDTDTYGPASSVMETYRHSTSTRNAIISRTSGNDASGHKQDVYFASEIVYSGGTTSYLDWTYDASTQTVIPFGSGFTQRSLLQIAFAWASCTAGVCGGSAAGCGIANMVDGETAFAPCFAAGCLGAGAVGCAITTALQSIR